VTGTVPRGGQCTPALPGAFVAEVGATAEEPCPVGTYSDGFGAVACTPAPVGTYVPVAGTADPLPCASATSEGATSCDDAGTDEAAAAVPILAESTGADAGGSGWVIAVVALAVALLVGFLHLQGVIAVPGLPGGPGVDRVRRPSAADRRRVRPVDRRGRPAAPASPARSTAGSEVLEWSEYDPALDDVPPDTEPPVPPRG
jgi:hypothetical protein